MILRHFIQALTALAAAAALTACSNEDFKDPAADGGEGNVKLTFVNARPGSRATADDANNEDAITSLHVFLYTNDADPATSAPVASKAFTGLTGKQTQTVSMSLKKDEVVDLFGSYTASGTCRMVALANLPASATVPDNPTIEQLRAVAVNSTFATEKVQPSFVMFGDTDEQRSGNTPVTFTPNDLGGSASGNVMLVRAAARISLNLRLPASLEITDGPEINRGTWTPMTQQMQVLLSNGVASSIADPSALAADYRPESDDYFNIAASEGDKAYLFALNAGVDATTGYPWQMTVPFYTYPNTWAISPDEQRRTYMTLILGWQHDRTGGSTDYHTCYYQVPVTDVITSGTSVLKRNTAYTVNLNVGMLGSFVPEEPLKIPASYVTVDWADVNTSVNINDYRYLVVNQNNYTVNNQSSISIPYFSSHEIEVTSITMSYKRFNAVDGGNGEVVDITVTNEQNNATGDHNNGQKIFTYEITKDAAGNNVLVINHELIPWTPIDSRGNTISETQAYSSVSNAQSTLNAATYYTPATGAAYSPYVFEITINHKGPDAGTAFEQKLKVTQYPGMYIMAYRNPGSNSRGDVYVNGNTGTRSEDWNTVRGLNGNNKNPNMYVITLNTLGTTQGQENFVIDDPRTFFTYNLNSAPTTTIGSSNSDQGAATSNNNTGRWSYSAPALYNTSPSSRNRTLTWYYPTNESNEYEMTVAPKMRIASSYGVCGSAINKNEARRRCATYQERGCPAGRWRMPTFGELQFIVNLSVQGKIPRLFNNGSDYFTAQGLVTIGNTLQYSSGSGYVRCVYDEWYWEKFDQYQISESGASYTLGDMPKKNPEEQ